MRNRRMRVPGGTYFIAMRLAHPRSRARVTGNGTTVDFRALNAYLRCMNSQSYTDFRKNLAATLDRVARDHEPVVITRTAGKPAAVLMSLEDYAAYEETRYLLQSPRNAERLAQAVAELDGGGGSLRGLTD